MTILWYKKLILVQHLPQSLHMRSFLCFIVLVVQLRTSAQDTLSSKILDEVVVTATRTERKLGNVAIPTQIVSKRALQLSGSLRLNDILQEQSGLFVTSGSGSGAVGGGIFGNGIQMQGCLLYTSDAADE